MSEPLIRVCSMCGKAYGPEYADTFCLCGFELIVPSGPDSVLPALAPGAPVPPAEAPLPPPVMPDMPPPGTRCLVLYGTDRLPSHYFPLTRDITLIGRKDPVEANFPDIDLTEWLDASAARRVSRKHAMILHVRASDSFMLRPLAGNTGTQLETDMLPAQQDVPLKPGQRLILGGEVRFKFEIV
jgi:FHA domain